MSNNFQTFDSNILINTSSFKHNIFGKIAASENGQYQICTTFIGGIVTSNTFGRMWRHFSNQVLIFLISHVFQRVEK